MAEASRRERLEEFFRRIIAEKPCSSADEALELLTNLLNAVEDELTTIPYDPTAWARDGRMYPPQADRRVRHGTAPVWRYRNVRTWTAIGDNGAIEISDVIGHVLLAKAGADGLTIAEVIEHAQEG